ncbi:acyltransferase family protein [[Erwinia] mediterraneensis]|uniref:acyltransferase family protein n=1 Tax=[Erwinia] mediterraneensis TaxID=2161819 RepID=UPI00102F3532|nr:acyltransferase family protein [[Erwinia] mediterraneensis]
MSEKKSCAYRADIDGLRAVAILLVVLFHSGVPMLSGGYIGVDVFFVISGFLIGGIISREIAAGTFSFYQFWLRRIRRIIPALFFLLFTLFAICYFILSPLELRQLAKYSVSVLLSVPNVLLYKSDDYFSISSDLNPLLMTWSLGIEEQFYILLPIILLLTARVKRSPLLVIGLLTLASFVACLLITQLNSRGAFYLLPTRAWELGVGVLLALWKPQPFSGRAANGMTLLGLVLIAGSALLLNKEAQFPGWLALLPVTGAALLIAARGSLSQRLLENSSARFIGKISYSWYLWHWPLLSLARICSDTPLSISQGLVISALALLIAWFSWRWIEQPFRQAATNTRPVIPVWGTVTMVACLGMTSVWASGGLKHRVNQLVVNGESYKIAAENNPCLQLYDASAPSAHQQCQPPTRQPAVALVGDSHAAALRTSVANYAQRRNKALFQLTKASCPFLLGTTRDVTGRPAHAHQCTTFNNSVMRTLLSDRIDEVVITAYWTAGMEKARGKGYLAPYNPQLNNLQALKAGMDKVVARLLAAGKKVMIIEDAPSLAIDPLRYSNNRHIPLRRQLNALLTAWNGESPVMERTHLVHFPAREIDTLLESYRQPGVRVVSLRKNLCSEQGCLISARGLPVYYDDNHLSPHGGDIALGKNW